MVLFSYGLFPLDPEILYLKPQLDFGVMLGCYVFINISCVEDHLEQIHVNITKYNYKTRDSL
jgi:hypothetical protein